MAYQRQCLAMFAEAGFETRIKLTLENGVVNVPEVVEEIYTWFKEEATSDSLADAIQALSDEYEEEEIRLVRIKFLCEVAN